MTDKTTAMTNHLNSPNWFFDRVLEFRYFLLLLCLVFFTDSYLVVTHQKSLVSFVVSTKQDSLLIGESIIFLALFSFVLVFVFPAILFLSRYLVSAVPGLIVHRSRTAEDDYVTVYDLNKQAIANKDNFAMSLVKEHESQQERIQNDVSLGFSAFSMVVVNYALGKFVGETITSIVLTRLSHLTGFHWYFFGSLFCFSSFLLFAIVWRALFVSNVNGYIYAPGYAVKKQPRPGVVDHSQGVDIAGCGDVREQHPVQ